MDVILAAAAALGMVVAALSGRMRRMPVSEPLLGLAAGVALGHTGALELPPVTEQPVGYYDATRVLLAISVMAVALRFPFQQVRRQAAPLLLLLLVVMPVMAAVNTALAVVVLGLAPTAAFVLGTALCPTDPVLASNVVGGKPAVHDIDRRTRLLLSLESGANDGLASPLVLVALFAAGASEAGQTALESAWGVAGGAGVGLLLGWIGGWALRVGEEHGATEHTPALFFTLLLAVGVLGAAGLAHVDGIVATFVAGLMFNCVSTGEERGGSVAIDEGLNRFLILPLFLVVGVVLPWSDWADLGWRGLLLVLAILLFRRLPILLLLRRPLRLRWPDAVFVGWFGPVGVAALLYLLLAVERTSLDQSVFAAGMLVVAGSTVAHGLTVTIGRRTYLRHLPPRRITP